MGRRLWRAFERITVITDVDIVRVLLARLVSGRRPLAVFVDGGEERFQSLLLRVDPRHDTLLLDELHPREGHRRVRPGSELRVSGWIDGVELRFRSRVRAIDVDGEISAYKLDLPAAVDHREYRNFYRTRLARSRTIHAWLGREGAAAIRALVIDISAGGVRLAVPRPHPLAIGDAWDCRLALPDGEADVRLDVLRVSDADPHAGPLDERTDHVGARFRELDEDVSRRIGQFMTAVQRDLLRAQREKTEEELPA